MEEARKKRIMLTVAYDGSAYCGWQVQPNGETIEGVLNRTLSAFFEENITVTGASRTDAGVHALCNKAVFDVTTRMPAEKISYALNRYLPEDITIRRSEEVAADFHPRKTATSKTYTYSIYNAPFPDPTKRLYSYFTYVPLDIGKMKEAAAYFLGEHDFAAFCTFKPETESTVRTITAISIESETEPESGFAGPVKIKVSGNGFLYHMVRIIAGTLIEVGRGSLEPERIPEIMGSLDRTKAGPTAPACGLMMTELLFTEDKSYYSQ